MTFFTDGGRPTAPVNLPLTKCAANAIPECQEEPISCQPGGCTDPGTCSRRRRPAHT